MMRTWNQLKTFLRWLFDKEWSSLRTVGQSKILGFTIIVPLLGYLIVFNQQLIEFLLPLQSATEVWSGRTVSNVDKTRHDFTLTRIQYAYFGLSFLGMSALFFSMFCPKEIKSAATGDEFIANQRPLLTELRLSSLLSQVARDYLLRVGSDEIRGVKYPLPLRAWTYPPELEMGFRDVISDIFNRSSSEDETASEEFLDEHGFFVGTQLNVQAFAEVLLYQSNYEGQIWLRIFRAARSADIDLLSLRYRRLDHSWPLLRLAITIMYYAGFALLSIPTAETFYMIIKGAI